MKKITLKLSFLFLSITCIFSLSCNQKAGNNADESQNQEEGLFTLVSSESSGLDFNNIIGLDSTEDILTNLYYYNGTGASAGDINNDGLTDLYFTSNEGTSKLYLNLGNLKFEDITEKAGVKTSGWCTGTTMADVNGDGWLDIYVCRAGHKEPELRRNLLFINNGNGTFTENAIKAGIADEGWATQATFFDMDNDGDLDAFVGNYPSEFNKDIKETSEYQKTDNYSSDQLHENLGNGTFKNISDKAGIHNYTHTLSIISTDFDNDGFIDIFCGNDFYDPDFLYHNNGNGTFTEIAKKSFPYFSSNSMGADAADINEDGLPDLIVVDMLAEDAYRRKVLVGPVNHDRFMLTVLHGYHYQHMRNMLHLNLGNNKFNEIGNFSGVEATDWSWSPLWADFDNDGRKDLMVANGFIREIVNQDFSMYGMGYTSATESKNKTLKEVEKLKAKKLRNYMFRNMGGERFNDVTQQWGFTAETISSGAIYADLDNDGDLDVVLCNLNDPVTLYKNAASEKKLNNHIKVKFKGQKNTSGIGCKVIITTNGVVQHYDNIVTRGYQSAVAPEITAGLGKNELADKVEIIWPGGKSNVFLNVKTNTVITALEAESKTRTPVEANPIKFFTENSASKGLLFNHHEMDFIDFKREPLLLHRFSQAGPGIAVGDVNNDGLDDAIITGSIGSVTTLYLQTSKGFKKAGSQPWSNYKTSEFLGAVIADFNNDKNPDIYLSAGSNENIDTLSDQYKDRLFLGDGKGNFRYDENALPAMHGSKGAIAAADIDGDGDLDIFTGGYCVPRYYPLAPRSWLLINNGGKFTDETYRWNAELGRVGMVSSVLFTDFNNDNKKDLIVVGEWDKIRCFKNNGISFSEETEAMGLGDTRGWWNSIIGGDFDNDGDIDYIVGNKGDNSLIQAGPSNPVKMYLGDFNKDGIPEGVQTHVLMGKETTLNTRLDLEMQMRSYMSKKYRRYVDFANATISEILELNKNKETQVWEINSFKSVYLENKNGKMVLKNLPDQAQLGPVYGTVVFDVNNDGNLDVLAVGNSYSPKLELGRDDALRGIVLVGDGKGNFKAEAGYKYGFDASGDCKSLAVCKTPSGPAFLVGRNNNMMLSFGLDSKLAEQHYGKIKKDNSVNKTKTEHYIGGGYLSQSSASYIRNP